MRGDIAYTWEDWERLAEDYIRLIPPDNEAFDFDLVTKWEFDEDNRIFIFYFDNEWDMDAFYDKITESPAYETLYAIGDLFEGVDRENLKIIVEGKEGGLW